MIYLLILKGFIIGIGKIIPGVSGSLIAISLNVYEKAIDCIINLNKNKKENILFLFKLTVGILVSIAFFSKVIIFLIDNYFVQTIMLFIGFIFSSVSELNENIKSNKIKNIAISIIFLILIILLGLITTNNKAYESNSLNLFYFFLSGVIDAFSMIVPGISGTALLMMLGTYECIVSVYSNIFNIEMFNSNFIVLFPFFFGLLLGGYFTIRLINYLFKHHKNNTYSAIKGLSYGSIFLMWLKCKPYLNFSNLMAGLILLITGYLVMKKINQIIK